MIKTTVINKILKKATDPKLMEVDGTYLLSDGFVGAVVNDEYLQSIGYMDFNRNISEGVKKSDVLKNSNIKYYMTSYPSELIALNDSQLMFHTKNTYKIRTIKILESCVNSVTEWIPFDNEKLEIFKDCEFYRMKKSDINLILAYKDGKLQGFCLPIFKEEVVRIINKKANLIEQIKVNA